MCLRSNTEKLIGTNCFEEKLAKMEINRFNLFFFFTEEWAKRRPSLANLSIWTLVSYARKFDTMKKQLVTTHNQIYRGGDRRRKDYVEDLSPLSTDPTSAEAKKGQKGQKTVDVVYFENSTIPKYDLEEVKNLHLPQELENLICTRQAAKSR